MTYIVHLSDLYNNHIIYWCNKNNTTTKNHSDNNNNNNINNKINDSRNNAFVFYDINRCINK